MRAKMILALACLIPFLLLFIYVWTTATNYIYSDEIYIIKGNVIENYLNGTLTFSDLWQSVWSVRALGCILLILADTKWFSLNSKIFIPLMPLLLLSSTLLIYMEYRKSLTPERSPEFISATFFALTLIIFNIIQWEALIFRGSLFYQLPMPFIIASFISLELYLTKGRKYWFPALILTTLALLVFGGTPVFSFLPALGITFLCYVLTHRSSLMKDFYIRSLITSALLFVIIFIYAFPMNHNNYTSLLPLDIVAYIFDSPLKALQFLLSAFGASIIGVDTFFAHDLFSYRSILVIGLILVLFYALALILFFKSRMYEKTFLPFFFIVQTFFFLLFMTIARFGFNLMALGMASRYTCISIFGVVGIIWIFIFVLTQPAKMHLLQKTTIYAGFAIIFSGLLLTSIDTWKIQPERKAQYKQLHDIAMRVDTASDEELWKFAYDPEKVRGALRLLRQYKLNVYCTVPEGKK